MNQELVNRIVASPQLPTLPVIAMKVLELTRREDVSVPEIANLIMTDAALASKILKTVNSPFYGLTKQVSTISSALVILGLQAAKTLALGFTLLANLKQPGDKSEAGFDHTAFWKRSIYAAVSSRAIARKMSVIQQEEAFLGGLFSSIGVLVLHRVLPQEFDLLFKQAGGDYTRLNALCQEKLDIMPPQVSALLAEKWQLPPLLAMPIALQLDPSGAEPALKPLVDAVSTGTLVAGVFVAENPAAAIAEARAALAERFGLPPEEIETLLGEIGAASREAAAMMDMHIGAQRAYQEILDEAQDTLVSLSLKSQQQVQTFQKEVETLQVEGV